ncbi:polar amino acid transport system permease protein/cystine transport system permease protein [Neorhizobium galegae]|uniref:amino acid ABC transporter permease n=1 Tax=Neorhizobium galegae TaxID=399 RepID=UPI00277E1472|nr:amino acid ABC transporter permease [Neorhizobium galegae]MDQ0138079.1 polar amino acid transport system permease protein/cystine transport system permease protein [Neorhizobium galegae]
MNEWLRAIPMLPEILSVLAWGAITTIHVTIGAFILATAIGLSLGIIQTLPSRIARFLIASYVEFFRGIPVLTQLFVLYFGLAQIGFKLDAITVAILGFGINGGAYLTEVFRAGIQSVNRGQMEAALMIGMTRIPALRHVILPQAMRVALPPLANFSVGLLKDTALASAVAAPELSFYARNLVTRTYLSAPIYAATAVMYIAMSLPLAYLARRLEQRFARGVRT